MSNLQFYTQNIQKNTSKTSGYWQILLNRNVILPKQFILAIFWILNLSTIIRKVRLKLISETFFWAYLLKTFYDILWNMTGDFERFNCFKT